MADSRLEEEREKEGATQTQFTRCLIIGCVVLAIIALLAVMSTVFLVLNGKYKIVSKSELSNGDTELDMSSDSEEAYLQSELHSRNKRQQTIREESLTSDVTVDGNPGTNVGVVANIVRPVMTAVRNDALLQDCGSSNLKRTFPDIDYSMYGYNILLGYPLADGRDPGFTRPLFAFNFSSQQHTADCRFSIPNGLTAAPDVACITSFTSQTIENSKDLEKSLDVNAHVSGGGWGVSFSASVGYKKTTSEVSTGKTKIIQSTANCKYYFTKINQLDMPDYSVEMIEWFERMNKSMEKTGFINDNLIYSFLDYFGTHFPIEMVYGARFTYENRVTSSSFKSLSSRDISVEAQASYSGLFSVGGGFGMSDSQRSAAENFQENTETRTTSVGAPPPYDGDAMTWASTVKDSPVPVQFNLAPIYDLFSIQYTTRRYFTEATRMHIRDKMISLVPRYCRRLADTGVGAECNDASVIRFNDIEPRGFDKKFNNVSLGRCINECLRKKDCLIATHHTVDNKCYLMDLTSLRSPRYNIVGNMAKCNGNCSSFIITQQLAQTINFDKFAYDETVSRRNKYNILGSTDYNTLQKSCEFSCSIDSFCTGFEISNFSDYNYNCATFSDHSETVVPTPRYVFELQLMSDFAKRDFQTVNINNKRSWFAQTYAVLQANQTFSERFINCNEICCESVCKSASDCVTAVFVRHTNTCHIQRDDLRAELGLTRSGSGADYVKVFVFYERASSGWVNVTGVARVTPSTKKSDIESAEECAMLCTNNVVCFVASWQAQSSTCNTYEITFWSITNIAPATATSKLMFPSSLGKLRRFKLYS